MKLYKLTYETEVVILAENEKEAISSAEYYVIDATHELVDWELVETMYELKKSPEWIGSIPYSSYKDMNPLDKKCEEFLIA